MNEKEFLAEVRSGRGGGYLFFGDEEFLKSRYLAMAKKEVCGDGSLDAFNYVKISADNFSPEAVENAVTALPLMADRRFIVMSGVKYNSLKQDDLGRLLSVLALLPENPQAVFIALTTGFEFDPGYLPKRPSKLYSSLTEHLKPVCFQRPPEPELKKWICRHFAAEGIEADLRTADMMILHAGHDMTALESEIGKLCMYLRAQGRTAPTAQDIENVVCPNVEADDFAFANAWRLRDRRRVFELLGMMEGEKVEEIVILGMISRYFTDLYDVKLYYEDGYDRYAIASALKMNDYRVKLALEACSGYTLGQLERAVAVCRNADLLLKSAPVVKYATVDRVTAELLTL